MGWVGSWREGVGMVGRELVRLVLARYLILLSRGLYAFTRFVFSGLFFLIPSLLPSLNPFSLFPSRGKRDWWPRGS